MLTAMAYDTNSASLNNAASRISKLVTFLSIWKIMIIMAGPEQNAEAKNLGVRIEAFQKGLAARPL